MGCGSSREADEVHSLVTKLGGSNDGSTMLAAVRQLAKLSRAHDLELGKVISTKNAQYQDLIISLGGLEKLVELCVSDEVAPDDVAPGTGVSSSPGDEEMMERSSSSLSIRLSASECVLNLSFDIANSFTIIQKGGLRAVHRCMTSQHDIIRQNGIWTLVNLLINQKNHPECVKNSELMEVVVAHLSHPDVNTRFWALRCVCNFCLGTPDIQIKLSQLGVLLPIFAILRTEQPPKEHATDARMKFFACACLSNLTSKNTVVENDIVEQGGLDVLFPLLSSAQDNIPSEAAKVVTNLAVQNEKNQLKIIEKNGLSYILPLANCGVDACEYQAACALLNLSQNTFVRKNYLNNNASGTLNIFQTIHHLLKSGKHEVQRKAAAIVTIIAEDEDGRKEIQKLPGIEKKLRELSMTEDLSNFDALMARVRAAQALSTVTGDVSVYKLTLMDSIACVMNKFEFSYSPSVEKWMSSYNNLRSASGNGDVGGMGAGAYDVDRIASVDVAEVQGVFNKFTENLQTQALMGVLKHHDGGGGNGGGSRSSTPLSSSSSSPLTSMAQRK